LPLFLIVQNFSFFLLLFFCIIRKQVLSKNAVLIV
jgi:hypothetical protein